MIKGLISVIVPVYKVEAYLEQCIQSIVDQTYQNLEIILVDDGSPDRCPQICDTWSQKDSRVRVIHQKNGGLSAARNAGLDAAHGEYVGFVDSDDYIAPTMYETLFCALQGKSQKMASCLATRVSEQGEVIAPVAEGREAALAPKEALDVCFRERVSNAVWCNLYEYSVWKIQRFPVGEVNEDYPLLIPSIASAAGLVVVRKPLYFYRRRQGSITADGYKLSRNSGFVYKNLFVMKQQLTEYRLLCEKSYAFFAARVSLFMVSSMEKQRRSLDEEGRTLLKKYRALMRENCWQFFVSRDCSLKEKLLYLAAITGTLRLVYKVLYKV